MSIATTHARIVVKHDPQAPVSIGAAVPVALPFIASLLADPDLDDPEGKALMDWTLRFIEAHPDERSARSSSLIVTAAHQHPAWVEPHQKPALFLLAFD